MLLLFFKHFRASWWFVSRERRVCWAQQLPGNIAGRWDTLNTPPPGFQYNLEITRQTWTSVAMNGDTARTPHKYCWSITISSEVMCRSLLWCYCDCQPGLHAGLRSDPTQFGAVATSVSVAVIDSKLHQVAGRFTCFTIVTKLNTKNKGRHFDCNSTIFIPTKLAIRFNP